VKQVKKPEDGIGRALLWVSFLSFSYFLFEFFFALAIDSVSLLADSLDFLEDGFITLLVFLSLRWSVRVRARIGRFFAIIILVPSIWTAIQAFEKSLNPREPEVLSMILVAVGAAVMTIICAAILFRVRSLGGPLVKDAWIVTRNDVGINFAIVLMGFVTYFWIQNGWPDILLGVVILLLNGSAAWTIWKTAHLEKIS
jgi:Co/Zn/Cd efflux system component